MLKSRSRTALAVGLARWEFAAVAGTLERRGFVCEQTEHAQAAMELLTQVPADVVLVRFPLPGMELQSFLEALRWPSSASRRTRVMLLAGHGMQDAGRRYIGRGANDVLLLDDPGQQLEQLLAGPLHAAPRTRVSFMTLVDAPGGAGRERSFVEATNISRTGILLTGGRKYEPGTTFDFYFMLPHDLRPACGTAEVVRHTQTDREVNDGVGARFVRFKDDSERRLKRYLDQRQEPPVANE